MDAIATEVGWYVISFVGIIVVCWILSLIFGDKNGRKR